MLTLLALAGMVSQQLPPPGARPHHPPPFAALEIAYAAVIIIACAIILFRTRRLYDVSKHKGIRHFSMAFFFFGLSYLFRFVPLLLRSADIHLGQGRLFFEAGIVLFGYTSSMAILSMLRSVTWKRLERGILARSWPYHALAIVLSGLAVLLHSMTVLLLGEVLLLILLIVLSFLFHRQERHKRSSATYYTYLLLSLFWTLNILIIVIPPFLPLPKVMLYILSTGLFLIILYRVLRLTTGR